MLFGKSSEIVAFKHKLKADAQVPAKVQTYWCVPLALQAEVVAKQEHMISEGVFEHIDEHLALG
jgi:predicted cobalt transporter CbtA